MFVLVKADSSLLFKRLTALKSYHRVLMTGVRITVSIWRNYPNTFSQDAIKQQYP